MNVFSHLLFNYKKMRKTKEVYTKRYIQNKNV